MSEAVIHADVAVIGAGSAGLVARRHALRSGAKRVLLIEGGPYGTTCARVGCMPSKLLIAAADAAEQLRSARMFGIEAGSVEIDGAAVMARVQRERDRFAGFAVESSEAIDASDRVRGWARFVGPRSLVVDTAEGSVRVEARAVVVATGSTPWVPPGLRGLGDRLLTSDSVFELPTLPRSLAVVGAGAIGLELGQAMHRLGVETMIFAKGSRMPLVSSEVMQGVARELFEASLALHLGVADVAGERLEGDRGVQLRWTGADGGAREAEFEYVLAATGRRSQLDRLDLGQAGVELDAEGRPTSWDLRTTQIADAPIFMAGDVTGVRTILHEASAEGRIAGSNAARHPDVRAHDRQVPLRIMFTDPNIAVVGEIPGDADERACAFGEVDFSNQGRARIIGHAHGRVRIYGRREGGEILGAEMIGPGAEHMAHLLAWSIEQGLSAQRAVEMPYYHPVVEEGLRTAFGELAKKCRA
ncbi:Dihydrolipoyl dehydrogenase [Enhygromyxa salina]|uniref:Dihydrolipoyl dehydrogenase n=1 Tax=Enhygromyxa salina TaxID=215803 RepID=A0A2S9YFR6_9BACT|nr:dihydrolipoyl dehydrogenase [Enhygromyxa salina]PRQ03846.1 Dihydrolipoyl dehydrogenase [Enhygromyxa salina]